MSASRGARRKRCGSRRAVIELLGPSNRDVGYHPAVFQLLALVAGIATAQDCAHRLTVAPVAMVGGWTDLPVPTGVSVRFDGVLGCPEPDSEVALTPGTVGLHLDLAYAPFWVHHTGWFDSARQQVGLQLEPWALTRGAARGVYVNGRLGVAEWFLAPAVVAIVPSGVLGYRFEPGRRVTLQVGGGVGLQDRVGFPILELRGGVMLGGRRD
jgi:hypothetical protein